MTETLPKYLEGIEDINELDPLLDKIIKSKEIIPFNHEKCLDWVKELYQKTKENPTIDNLLYYGRAMFPGFEQETSFKAYAEVLAIDRESPQAFHYVGKILMNNHLFLQSHLLFENGIALDSSSILDPYRKNRNFHRKFHYDLGDLIGRINDDTLGEIRISNYGFPIERLGFVFDEKKGFHIPNFAYNSFNTDYEIYGLPVGKERTLMHIHGKLARINKIKRKPHNAGNCPYLGLLR